MSVTSLKDVTASLRRPLSPEETEYAPALIDRVENAIIAPRLPGASSTAASDSLYHAVYTAVVAEAVARVLRAENQGIYRSESEDGYSYQLNYLVASGLLDVLPSEWERLGYSPYGSYQPLTDGYAASRYNGRPDLHLQYSWPGASYPSVGYPVEGP